MDKDQYVAMVNRLLEDKDTCKILERNPSAEYVIKFKTILTEAKHNSIISEDELKYLLNTCPTISTMYALLKVHKKSRPIPSRPIVSGNDNLIQNISIYVNDMLAPFVAALP